MLPEIKRDSQNSRSVLLVRWMRRAYLEAIFIVDCCRVRAVNEFAVQCQGIKLLYCGIPESRG